jgi:hypothetical protein
MGCPRRPVHKPEAIHPAGLVGIESPVGLEHIVDRLNQTETAVIVGVAGGPGLVVARGLGPAALGPGAADQGRGWEWALGRVGQCSPGPGSAAETAGSWQCDG